MTSAWSESAMLQSGLGAVPKLRLLRSKRRLVDDVAHVVDRLRYCSKGDPDYFRLESLFQHCPSSVPASRK